MSLMPTAAAGGAPAVNNTGPGPRQPLGLPPAAKGVANVPRPPVPMSAYGSYSKAGPPGPTIMGQPYLYPPTKPSMPGS